MTKQKQIEQLQYELRVEKSKRNTPVVRDVPPPGSFQDLSLGWDFNSYSREVFKACSSSAHHGTGWERTSTQQPRALFSTELRAALALRQEVQELHTEIMADIDRKILGLLP